MQLKCPGVGLDKRRNTWFSTIKVNGKNIYLGAYRNIDDAIKKRKEAEIIYHEPKKKQRQLFETEVVNFYKQGNTLKKTGLKFNRTDSSIYDILIKNSIKIRDNTKNLNESLIIELYNSGKSGENVAKELNISHGSVNRRLIKNGIKIRPNRKHFFDETIFEKIDCEWKAYYLGLFYADAGVGKINIGLSLIESDRELIDKLNDIVYDGKFPLNYIPAKTYICKKNGKIYNNKPQIKIYLNSKKTVSDLIALGCIPRKSFTLQFPSFDIIPKSLFNHFIRGYFDGDGHKVKHTFGIISSDDFCNGFKKFLIDELNIGSFLHKAGKVSRVFVHKIKDTNKIKEYLYNNATIYLKRKFNKFE